MVFQDMIGPKMVNGCCERKQASYIFSLLPMGTSAWLCMSIRAATLPPGSINNKVTVQAKKPRKSYLGTGSSITAIQDLRDLVALWDFMRFERIA